jgi:hypothetical protein
MKIASQEWFDMQGHKITVIEPESRGKLQDYFDEKRNEMWVQYCADETEQHNRKARIAFGLELYDPEKETWFKKS